VIVLGDNGAGISPGRGTWAGRVVQLVDMAAGSTVAETTPHADAIVVRPLPAAVLLARLPDPRPEHVPFGVGGDAARPLAVDLTGPGGGVIVAGPRRSGVTTTLAVLAGQAARARIPTLWVMAGRADAPPDLPSVTIVSCQGGTGELAAALRSYEGPLLLVADHGGLGDDHPAADLFQRFLMVCGAGQHLLIGARTDAFLRSRHGHLQAAASYRRGMLLAPDQAHGPLLDLSLPKRSGPVTAGRGVWTWDGDTVAAQIALVGGAPAQRCEQAHAADC
jgi:S-DNA-T family DNA segregation ATPase FtsK/SpoIIIE